MSSDPKPTVEALTAEECAAEASFVHNLDGERRLYATLAHVLRALSALDRKLRGERGSAELAARCDLECTQCSDHARAEPAKPEARAWRVLPEPFAGHPVYSLRDDDEPTGKGVVIWRVNGWHALYEPDNATYESLALAFAKAERMMGCELQADRAATLAAPSPESEREHVSAPSGAKENEHDHVPGSAVVVGSDAAVAREDDAHGSRAQDAGAAAGGSGGAARSSRNRVLQPADGGARGEGRAGDDGNRRAGTDGRQESGVVTPSAPDRSKVPVGYEVWPDDGPWFGTEPSSEPHPPLWYWCDVRQRDYSGTLAVTTETEAIDACWQHFDATHNPVPEAAGAVVPWECPEAWTHELITAALDGASVLQRAITAHVGPTIDSLRSALAVALVERDGAVKRGQMMAEQCEHLRAKAAEVHAVLAAEFMPENVVGGIIDLVTLAKHAAKHHAWHHDAEESAERMRRSGAEAVANVIADRDLADATIAAALNALNLIEDEDDYPSGKSALVDGVREVCEEVKILRTKLDAAVEHLRALVTALGNRGGPHWDARQAARRWLATLAKPEGG